MHDRKGPEALRDPVLAAVLANRLDGIVREMTNTLLRSARSALINTGRDFSCAITTADNQLLAVAEVRRELVREGPLIAGALPDPRAALELLAVEGGGPLGDRIGAGLEAAVWPPSMPSALKLAKYTILPAH